MQVSFKPYASSCGLTDAGAGRGRGGSTHSPASSSSSPVLLSSSSANSDHKTKEKQPASKESPAPIITSGLELMSSNKKLGATVSPPSSSSSGPPGSLYSSDPAASPAFRAGDPAFPGPAPHCSPGGICKDPACRDPTCPTATYQVQFCQVLGGLRPSLPCTLYLHCALVRPTWPGWPCRPATWSYWRATSCTARRG